MKVLPIAAAITALAMATAVVAQQAAAPANKADCEKAKMKWDAKGGKDGKGTCMAKETPKKK
jgi:hypothetical protein